MFPNSRKSAPTFYKKNFRSVFQPWTYRTPKANLSPYLRCSPDRMSIHSSQLGHLTESRRNFFLNFHTHDLATWKSVQLPNLRNIAILRIQKIGLKNPKRIISQSEKMLKFLNSNVYPAENLHLARLTTALPSSIFCQLVHLSRAPCPSRLERCVQKAGSAFCVNLLIPPIKNQGLSTLRNPWFCTYRVNIPFFGNFAVQWILLFSGFLLWNLVLARYLPSLTLPRLHSPKPPPACPHIYIYHFPFLEFIAEDRNHDKKICNALDVTIRVWVNC